MKDNLFYKVLRPVWSFLFRIIFWPKVVVKEKVPKEAVVLAGTHTNILDCILLSLVTKRQIHFLAKDALYKGWKKPLFKALGIIPVDRSRKSPEVMDMARKTLNEGKVIGIFPEGTINRTKDVIMPFKYGAVKMAMDTNSYIVPFAIIGKYKPFGKVKIVLDKPYKINNSNIEENNKELMNKVISLIKENK